MNINSQLNATIFSLRGRQEGKSSTDLHQRTALALEREPEAVFINVQNKWANTCTHIQISAVASWPLAGKVLVFLLALFFWEELNPGIDLDYILTQFKNLHTWYGSFLLAALLSNLDKSGTCKMLHRNGLKNYRQSFMFSPDPWTPHL